MEGIDRTQLEVPAEDVKNGNCLRLVDDKAPVLRIIAKRRVATHPHALCLRGGDLVANALPGYLAFELRKRQQHVEGQSAHRGGGVKRLRH